MAKLGARIRALRTAKEITLPDLAEKAGLSKGLLSKIETDENSNPSLSTLLKISEALETTVAEILGTEKIVVKVPPKEPPEMHALADFLRKEGKEPDPDILGALAVLRHRKASKSASLEDWKFLYRSIENSFKR